MSTKLDQLSSWLKERKITEVECLISDLTGIARGKISPTNKFLDEKGMRLPESVLLQTVTGFVPGRVQAELNWYSQERGYPLSYLTGNHLVWQLFRDVRAAHSGSQEEADRDFFAAFLRAGNMPVAFLRRQFELDGLVK